MKHTNTTHEAHKHYTCPTQTLHMKQRQEHTACICQMKQHIACVHSKTQKPSVGILHVYHMCITCVSHVYPMCITCVLHVYLTKCIFFVNIDVVWYIWIYIYSLNMHVYTCSVLYLNIQIRMCRLFYPKRRSLSSIAAIRWTNRSCGTVPFTCACVCVRVCVCVCVRVCVCVCVCERESRRRSFSSIRWINHSCGTLP